MLDETGGFELICGREHRVLRRHATASIFELEVAERRLIKRFKVLGIDKRARGIFGVERLT